jgi:hypothetical protein
MTTLPTILILLLTLPLIASCTWLSARTDSTTDVARDRTETREGWAQIIHPATGDLVTVKHGETIREQETTKQITESVRVITVPVIENLTSAARTFGTDGGTTTAVGIGGTLLAAGLAAWQRHKRRQAEHTAERERALADRAADLQPEQARAVLAQNRAAP